MNNLRFRRLSPLIPWALLLLGLFTACWHILDFESDLDGEYPAVVRPTFSPWPPAAYRLAEPGDTLDRSSLYLASAAVGLSLTILAVLVTRRRPVALWPAALGIAAAAWWCAATPGPCPDGWHGLGWRSILNSQAPGVLRLGLLMSAILLTLLIVAPLWRVLRDNRPLQLLARASATARALLALALLLVLLRQVEIPGIGPPGYWPRWSFLLGMLCFLMALVALLPRFSAARLDRILRLSAACATGVGLVVLGLAVVEYHRPIPRLKAIVPGRLYISAMPDYKGLSLTHQRHHFRSIVNLFSEDTRERSPLWPQELRFVQEHEIRYLRSPAPSDDSIPFMRQTLALAQDPSAWPVLVHCHGCMDRTPAWVGIYRFLVEGKPLLSIMQEIEQHRGYRPKATVTLLYNYVLPILAPAAYSVDPLAGLLRDYARGEIGPYSREERDRRPSALAEQSPEEEAARAR